MAFSTLTLTFNVNPAVDEDLTINIDVGGGYQLNLLEVFKSIATRRGESNIGGNTNETASYYSQAFNAHYQIFGENSLLSLLDVSFDVIIIAENPSWQFLAPTGSVISSGDVTYVINNQTPEDEATATRTGYTAYVPSPCDSIYANYTVTGGNNSYNVWVDGVQQLTAQASPLSILVPRATFSSIVIQDTTGKVITNSLTEKAVKKVLASQISVAISNYVSSSTITISVSTSTANTPLEYSLTNNGIDWQTSNVFSGLVPNTYTVYVKDAFGCVTASNNVVITGTNTVSETVATLSEINPIRFSLLEETGKKNHKNTLSCAEVKQIAYPFYHKYLSTDTPTTQFKTNAQYINVFTLDQDKNTNTQSVFKQTENTGLEVKCTCTFFDLGGGRSGIYFGVIDILNVITEAVEDTIDLGFSLPEWADSVGKIVNISGIGDVEVATVEYNDTYDAFVLGFDFAFSGSASRILYSAYSIQPYEVYETVISMASEPTEFNLVIELGVDSNNIDFTYISERIKRVTDNDGLYEIDYWDDENKGEMVYQTGVQHKIRLDGMQQYVGFQELEGYDGDEQHYVTRNVIFDAQRFWFYRLSSEMAHKLRLIMAHKYLKINGLFYSLSEIPEITSTPTSNLNLFSVILKQSGEQFLTDDQEIITTDDTNDSIAAAIEASKGKAMILWTKTNG